MINKYSKKRDGSKKVSDSFRVREFACKDGSDVIYIDTKLVGYLQRIRNWAGAPVRITSGYRTKSHNAAVGGAGSSYHVKGRAADIVVTGKSVKDVAKYAEAIGVPGIECNEDSRYVHIDTRPGKYYWIRRGGKDITVSGFGGKCPYGEPGNNLRRGSKGNGVRWLQFWLKLWGRSLSVDGDFGKKTEDAVKDIQRRRGLKVDGIAGKKTRAALKGY
ncbi:MAG: peptidoglycan-binding protein [Oscillospiraceae bacterium]|nr:peptidoglycan-binding protein [Oscillospiraceae bacterium]